MEMDFGAIILRAWRAELSEFRDRLDGYDHVNLVMHSNAVIKWVTWSSRRRSMEEAPGAVTPFINYLTCDYPNVMTRVSI